MTDDLTTRVVRVLTAHGGFRSTVVTTVPGDLLRPEIPEADLVECGTCRRRWDDGQSTEWTPTPSGRCPFEYEHVPTVTADTVDIPLPGASVTPGTVIASVWTIDDGDRAPEALLLVLHPEPDYYGLYTATWADGWTYVHIGSHRNIVPAVEAYQDNGGDY